VVRSVLDVNPVDKGERQHPVLEQGENEANDGNDGLQQEANNVAAVRTSDRVGYMNSSEPQGPHDPVPEPGYGDIGSSSDSDGDDVNNNDIESDDDDGELHPTKRKRPFSSTESSTPKKRKQHIGQRPAGTRKIHSKVTPPL
jgi:hypothetical protein